MAPEHYTRRFNTRHRLFGDRYKAVLVDGANYYYETATKYIHCNPVRARIVSAARGESVLDYPSSSVAGGYAFLPGRRPAWLAGASLLEALGYPDTTPGRRKFVEHLDRRADDEAPAQWACRRQPPKVTPPQSSVARLVLGHTGVRREGSQARRCGASHDAALYPRRRH